MKKKNASSICTECGTRPAEVRDWCRTCYQRVRQRQDFVRVQLREPNDPPLEVRRCSHCLAPLPIGRVIRGLCSACHAYGRRTGNFRPADRERAMEGLAIIVADLLHGTAAMKDLAEAFEELEVVTAKFLNDRHMTKMRASHDSKIPRNARWIVNNAE